MTSISSVSWFSSGRDSRVRRRLGIGLLVGALTLGGCAAEPGTTATTSPTASTSASAPASSPTASASPAPSPTASVAPVSVELRLDELVVTDSQGSEQVLNVAGDPAGTRQAVLDLFGEMAPQRRDDRYPIDKYTWPGLTMFWYDTEPASVFVTFTAASEGDVALTAAGLSVGATVAQVEAAGAEITAYGTYGDTTAYRLNVQQVPGTSSLANPGQLGERYLEFDVVSGAVTRIVVGNDYSDL